MSKLGRAVVPTLVSGLAVLMCFAIEGRWRGAAPIRGSIGDGGRTARTRSWIQTDGFYPPEFAMAEQLQFSWTTSRATLTIPALDRSIPYRMALLVRAGRPQPVESWPDLIVTVDGLIAAHAPVSNDRQTVEVTLPSSKSTRAVVGLDVSSVFVPGPQDSRKLGLVVEEVAIEPAGPSRFPVPRPIVRDAVVSTMAYAVAATMCGLPWGLATLIGLLAAAGHTWLLFFDGAFLGTYATRLLRIATGLLIASAGVRTVTWFKGCSEAFPEWPVAAGVVLAATGMKLSFFVHPQVTLGDAMFHVHRAEWVHAGRYFFTSVTPRPFFEFPYPIGLYVTSWPVWGFFPTQADRVLMLRGLALIVDAGVGFAFYFVIRRIWANRAAALACAALVPFLRASFQALCSANLTNVYSQALFSLGMAFLIYRVGQRQVIVSVVVATLLLSGSFLSHFSTVSVGIPLVAAVALALRGAPVPAERAAALWVAVALAATVLLSYGVYYSRFHAVYRTAAARVIAREGEAPTRSMVAPPSVKLSSFVSRTRSAYGALVFALAGLGACAAVVRRQRDPLTLALLAWGVTWAACLVLGILTPVELRANLAAQPLMACLAALGLATLAGREHSWRRWLAGAVVCVVAAQGVRDWTMCLTGHW